MWVRRTNMNLLSVSWALAPPAGAPALQVHVFSTLRVSEERAHSRTLGGSAAIDQLQRALICDVPGGRGGFMDVLKKHKDKKLEC